MYEQFYRGHKPSDTIKRLFELYTIVGGYPSVVAVYMDTKEEGACLNELNQILDIFISESSRYFKSIVDYDVFELVLSKISKLAITEKKGKNLVGDLNRIVVKLSDSRIKKESIDNAVGWLHRSSIIGYTEKFIDGSANNSVPRAGYYLQDLGLAYLLGIRLQFSIQELHGYLAETYVYHTLRNRYYRASVRPDDNCLYSVGSYPAFSTYPKIDGELDFVLFGGLNGFKNGIGVKWGTGSAVTGSSMLNDSLIDNLYLLMGDCGLSDNGRVKCVPLYFADLIEYPLLKEKPPSFKGLLQEMDLFRQAD